MEMKINNKRFSLYFVDKKNFKSKLIESNTPFKIDKEMNLVKKIEDKKISTNQIYSKSNISNKKIIRIIYTNLYKYSKFTKVNFSIMIINNILYKSTIHNKYEELLINIDQTDFIEKFYNLYFCHEKLKNIGLFFHISKKIYPNYLQLDNYNFYFMNKYLNLKQKLLNNIDFEKKKRKKLLEHKKKLISKKKSLKLSLNESESSSFFSDDKNSNSNFLNNLSIESISFNKINEYYSDENNKNDNSFKDIYKIIDTINESEKILNEKYYNTIGIKEKKIFNELKNLYNNNNILINHRKKKFFTIDFQNAMKNQISKILMNYKKKDTKKIVQKKKKTITNNDMINFNNDLNNNNNKFQKSENFIYKLKMKKFAFDSVKQYFKNYINNPAHAVKTLNYQFDYRLPQIDNNTIENNNNNGLKNLKHHKIRSYDINLIKNYHNLKSDINGEKLYNRILNNENKSEQEYKLYLTNKKIFNKKSRNHLLNSNFNTTNTFHTFNHKIENFKTLPINVYKFNLN